MAMNFTTALNTSMANAIVTAASTACTVKIYTGAAPANADTAVTGTLLVTLTFGGGFGTVTSGVLTMGGINSNTAVATGTAGYARLATSGGTTLFDLTSIGTSGADLNLNSTSITSGGTVTVTSGTVTFPYP